MNENYLWNKAGDDPEIEKLENALKNLRLRQTAAPRIPVEREVERRNRFNIFRFALPATVCAAIALLAFGLWLQSASVNSRETAKNTIQLPIIEQSSDSGEPVTVAPIAAPDKLIEKVSERSAIKRSYKKIRPIRPVYVRANSTTAQKNKSVNSPNKLTREEQYAYDQLMTALAITGSQFKLVKDKLQKIEEQTADAR